jgi:hypothetical protein
VFRWQIDDERGDHAIELFAVAMRQKKLPFS